MRTVPSDSCLLIAGAAFVVVVGILVVGDVALSDFNRFRTFDRTSSSDREFDARA